jgi:hypothetical protein
MDDRLRIGDAEREAAAHELGEHYAMGRLTTEEHSERLERVWEARTSADLAPLFRDLPRVAPPKPPQPKPTAAQRVRGWLPDMPRVPSLFKVLVAILVVWLVVTRLPLLIILLLVWLFAIRRVGHRRRYHGHWR